MAKTRVHAFEGNSQFNEVNIYRDALDPSITYTGTMGGKSRCRNVWYVQDDRTGKRVGPFTALRLAVDWVNYPNGTATDVTNVTSIPDKFPTPEPLPVDDMPLLHFRCPSCGHELVGLVAAK